MATLKTLIYDEQYETVRHGGASTFVGHYTANTGHKVELFSFKNKRILSKLLYPYFRELLCYPLVFFRYKISPDIGLVVFNSTFTTFLRKPKIKSVVIVHCLFSLQAAKLRVLFAKYLQLPIRILSSILRFYEKKALSNVDLIVSPRKEICEFLVSEFGLSRENIEVVPQFVNQKIFYYKKKTKKYDFIFIGRLSKAKGYHDLLSFARANRELKFLVVTQSPIVGGEFENIVHEVNIPQEKLVELYNSSKILFMPSYSETGPLVTLEAMSCGVPVIGSVNGGGDFVESGVEGEIFDRFDAKTCYEFFQKIDQNYSYYSNNALEKSKSFDMATVLEEYDKLFESLLCEK